jgi:hypothetical protein
VLRMRPTMNVHNSVTVTNGENVDMTFFSQNFLINNLPKFGHFLPGHPVYNVSFTIERLQLVTNVKETWKRVLMEYTCLQNATFKNLRSFMILDFCYCR